jgi:hypothetical protein
MTQSSSHDFSQPMRASGPWSAAWHIWYRLLRIVGSPLMRLALGRGFGNVVVLRVRGRRSGRERALPLGLLSVAGQWYVGHPNGDAAWTLDLRKAGRAVLESARRPATTVRSTVLEPGPERDAVVRASFRQHPFPGNALYRLAGRHVAATGVFFRMEVEDPRLDQQAGDPERRSASRRRASTPG